MLRLTTLKDKIYAVIVASFIVRIIGFFLLPDEPTVALAPDEGGYAEISRIVADEEPTTSFGGLYVISRSLILPAVVLNNFGVEPLSSVRIIASIYGALSLILISLLIIKTVDKYADHSESTSRRDTLIVGLVSVFAFLPSHLLWSMLGLRESPMEFWVLCALACIYSALHLHERLSFLTAISLIISMILLFNSRPQVGIVLTISILIFLLFSFKDRIAVILIPITLIAFGLAYLSVSDISVQTQDVFMAKTVISVPTAEPTVTASPTRKPSLKPGKTATPSATPSETPSATPSETPSVAPSVAPSATPPTKLEVAAGLTCTQDNQVINSQGVEYLCSKTDEKRSIVGLKNPGKLVIDEAQAIPERHKGNQVAAASAIQTLSCPITEESDVDKYLCMAWRAPYMAATFLFRPLIGVDITSTSSLFAAIENIAWLGAFIFIVVMLIRKRRLAFFGPLTPSLIFFTLYCIGAGSYEGNMGTAFRHKSLILWVVLLLVGSVVAVKKRSNSGNELGEKAV